MNNKTRKRTERCYQQCNMPLKVHGMVKTHTKSGLNASGPSSMHAWASKKILGTPV